MPPKHKPGELLPSITQQEVNRALDDVIRAGKLMHDRGCAISISNEAGTPLENPRFWLYSGMSFAASQPEIHPGSTSLNLFVKKDWKATGTVGVMSYDIQDTDFKVAVSGVCPSTSTSGTSGITLRCIPRTARLISTCTIRCITTL